jgi:hypothetical protein
MCGSCHTSLRSRALRLIIASLATDDRRIDSKQLANFEKINGFAVLTEQLSQPVVTIRKSDLPARIKTEPTILEILLDFLFWKSLGGNIEDDILSTGDNLDRADSHDTNILEPEIFLEMDSTVKSRNLEHDALDVDQNQKDDLLKEQRESAYMISEQKQGAEQTVSTPGIFSSIFGGGGSKTVPIQIKPTGDDFTGALPRHAFPSSVTTPFGTEVVADVAVSVLGSEGIKAKHAIQTRRLTFSLFSIYFIVFNFLPPNIMQSC